jgi:hypothetical protein
VPNWRRVSCAAPSFQVFSRVSTIAVWVRRLICINGVNDRREYNHPSRLCGIVRSHCGRFLQRLGPVLGCLEQHDGGVNEVLI